jgi:sulfatase modifying factor 1
VRWAVLVVLVVPGVSCTKPAPGFCCLTLEDCQQFGVDEVRQCTANGDACIANQCVPAPDAAEAPDALMVDGAPAVQPSCVGLQSQCGPAGLSNCCSSPLVDHGTYFRSNDVGVDGMYPDQSSPATVADFRLDTYEITVGRFRRFVDAGMGTQQNPPAAGAGARMLNGMANQGGWDPTWTVSLPADSPALVASLACAPFQSWTDAPGANESLPITCVSWFEAAAFCAWDGGFLPTEAEWNYAAAGGDQQRAYPWSNPPSSLSLDCSYANYYNGVAYCVNDPIGGMNRVGSESPKGDGRWGQADLAGNAREWTLDWHAATYPSPCTDCANLTVSSNRVLRGGYYNDGATLLRGARRANAAPTTRSAMGIRCARAP